MLFYVSEYCTWNPVLILFNVLNLWYEKSEWGNIFESQRFRKIEPKGIINLQQKNTGIPLCILGLVNSKLKNFHWRAKYFSGRQRVLTFV